MTDNITLPREVVEGALEALDSEHPDIQLRAAIALRTHLAAEQPKPEPVVWQCREHGDDEWFDCTKEAYGINQSRYVYRCLYTTPPEDEALRRDAEQPKPEPVAWMDRFGSVVLGKEPYETFTTPLYTFPPALAAEQPKHPGYVIGSHWLETAYSRICAGEAEARVLRDYGSVSVGEAEALQRENEALRRDAERLKDAMRKAMAMLDKHEPEPAGAFAVLLLALNPELQSAKNAALRREET